MEGLFIFTMGLYAITFVVSIILITFKAKERIKEKPKDDSDLNKFDKY